jgi:gas vesicle protein
MEIQERTTRFPLFSTLLGATAGAITGFVIGILFAPRSGEETRQQIGDWVREKRDAGGEILANIKNEAMHKKEQVAAAVRAGKEAYQATGPKS